MDERGKEMNAEGGAKSEIFSGSSTWKSRNLKTNCPGHINKGRGEMDENE
jgi:hypothetical protein